MTKRVRLAGCSLAALLLLGTTAGAQTIDYYVHIPQIPGGATAQTHVGWIDSSGFSAVVEANSQQPPRLPPVFVGKWIDKASPLLASAVAADTDFPEAVLEAVQVQGKTRRVIYRLRLRGVRVASIEQKVNSTLDTEGITLAYTAIEWSYVPAAGDPIIAHFDSATNSGGTGPFPGATPTPTPAPLDSDGDGMPDEWEIANGLNPFFNDAFMDLDGDGAANIQEFRAGTRANDPHSVFRVSGISLPDGNILIRWRSVPGKTYRILGSATPGGTATIVRENIAASADAETTTTVPFSGQFLFFYVQTQ
jgi:type VI secretion system Hcp family effector